MTIHDRLQAGLAHFRAGLYAQSIDILEAGSKLFAKDHNFQGALIFAYSAFDIPSLPHILTHGRLGKTAEAEQLIMAGTGARISDVPSIHACPAGTARELVNRANLHMMVNSDATPAKADFAKAIAQYVCGVAMQSAN